VKEAMKPHYGFGGKRMELVGSISLSVSFESKFVTIDVVGMHVFAWKTFDLTGVSKIIIEHKLHVNPSAKPRKQKLRKMWDEKIVATKMEVQRLLDARCHYFEAHGVRVLTNQPLNDIFGNRDSSDWIGKWAM
jgi:hypothetical protein